MASTEVRFLKHDFPVHGKRRELKGFCRVRPWRQSFMFGRSVASKSLMLGCSAVPNLDGRAIRNANRGDSRESIRANRLAEKTSIFSSSASGGSLHEGASLR